MDTDRWIDREGKKVREKEKKEENGKGK